jgi:hypothetical protein
MADLRASSGLLLGVLIFVAGCDAPAPARLEPIAPVPASPVPTGTAPVTGRPAAPPVTSTTTRVRVTPTTSVPAAPPAPAPPPDATALCNDGTYSFSRRRPNACARHDGVARWL